MLRSIRPELRQNKRISEKPKPISIRTSGQKASFGIIYVAYGDRARHAVQASVRSLKSIHPNISTAVIAKEPISGVSRQIIQPEQDIGAREYKTQVYQYSPFDLTCYLDADTLVVGSLQPGFDILLSGWDMAAALDFRPIVAKIDHLPAEDVKAIINLTGTGEYPHFNTGVLFFRKCPEVESLFILWHDEWKRFKYRDQGAFVRALHQSDVKLWALASQWNTHKEHRAKHVFHIHKQVDRTLFREAQ